MANNGITTPVDDAGNPAQASRTAPLTLGGLQTVKTGPGRLHKLAVTTATASAAVTVYDSAGPASGNILAVIPAATNPGAPIDVNLPFTNGLTVQSTGATGNVTAGYA